MTGKTTTLDLSQHYSITSADKVCKIITPLTEAFDITHFRYLKLYSNGSRILLSNYADCTRFYYEEGHYKEIWFDGEFPNCLTEGWHIWDVMRAVNCDSNKSTLELEINQLLKLYFGITYIVKGPDFYEIYTFDSDKAGIYQIDKKVIIHFILYFKQQAKSFIAQGEKEKIIIPLQTPLFECITHSNKAKILSTLETMRLNRYYLSGKYEGVYLTSKEAQCAYWLLQGKTAEEIAGIENNCLKTIECHFENVRNKLNCFKQTQLVKIILEAGIFACKEN